MENNQTGSLVLPERRFRKPCDVSGYSDRHHRFVQINVTLRCMFCQPFLKFSSHFPLTFLGMCLCRSNKCSQFCCIKLQILRYVICTPKSRLCAYIHAPFLKYCEFLLIWCMKNNPTFNGRYLLCKLLYIQPIKSIIAKLDCKSQNQLLL